MPLYKYTVQFITIRAVFFESDEAEKMERSSNNNSQQQLTQSVTEHECFAKEAADC